MINISKLPEIMTVPEVANFLRVDVSTVRRWIRKGGMDAIELPHPLTQKKGYRVPRTSIEAIVNKHCQVIQIDE